MVDDVNLCLLEKQLDPTKCKKGNDNKGGVNGQEPVAVGTQEPLDVAGGTGVIEEFDDQQVDWDIEDSDEDEATVHEDSYRNRVKDITKAFSHFSYRYTKLLQLSERMTQLFRAYRPRAPRHSRLFQVAQVNSNHQDDIG
jgi:hypothetical protein